MRSYDSAMIHYSKLMRRIELLFNENSNYGNYGRIQDEKFKTSDRDVQLFIVPFVAYLALIEKNRNDGITYANLRDIEKRVMSLIQFDKLESELEKDESELDIYRKLTLAADYYSNVGSLLYYKNCQFPNVIKYDFLIQSKNLTIILDQLYDLYRNDERSFIPTTSAYVYYYKSIYYFNLFFRKRILNSGKREFFSTCKNSIDKLNISLLPCYLLPEYNDYINANKYYYLANITSKFSDVIYSNIHSNNLYPTDYIKEFNSIPSENILDTDIKKERVKHLINSFVKKENKVELNVYFSLETVLELLEVSAGLYSKAGKVKSSTFQYKKMLFILRECVYIYTSKDFNSSDNLIECAKNIAIKIARLMTLTADISNRPQILKYRELFDTVSKEDRNRALIYLNTCDVEVKEAIMLVEHIKSIVERNKGSVKKLTFMNHFISPFGNISNRYVRIFELEYVHLRNKKIALSEFEYIDLFSPNYQIHLKDFRIDFLNCRITLFQREKEIHLLMFLIKESIFALREIIRSIHIYGLNNVISYSYLANMHLELGDWCAAYRNLKQFLILNEDSFPNHMEILENEIKSLIGNQSMAYLEPNYHYEEAIKNFELAKSLHNEGRTYKANTHNLYFLEDDFNDNLRHFIIALERFRVNSGDIDKKIKKAKSIVRHSKLYQYESYFPLKANDSDSESKNGIQSN
ncbi:hypothetical protein [Ascidiimonas sp. W6]|uniref:hypothetical protein n=1 Tax=Ascidiimonas meishanensis TaxID=3128903 RepID=UPI0030EC01CB